MTEDVKITLMPSKAECELCGQTFDPRSSVWPDMCDPCEGEEDGA